MTYTGVPESHHIGRFNSEHTVNYENEPQQKDSKATMSFFKRRKSWIWMILTILVTCGIATVVTLLILKNKPTSNAQGLIDSFLINSSMPVPSGRGASISVANGLVNVAFGSSLFTISTMQKSIQEKKFTGIVNGVASSASKTFVSIGESVIDNDGNIVTKSPRDDDVGILTYSDKGDKSIAVSTLFVASGNTANIDRFNLDSKQFTSSLQPSPMTIDLIQHMAISNGRVYCLIDNKLFGETNGNRLSQITNIRTNSGSNTGNERLPSFQFSAIASDPDGLIYLADINSSHILRGRITSDTNLEIIQEFKEFMVDQSVITAVKPVALAIDSSSIFILETDRLLRVPL